MPLAPRAGSLPKAATRMHVEDRRRLLVDSAITEFGLHGFAGTTTDAIARRAGISQPYVVRLFGTKKALFLAAIERCFDTVTELFRAAASGAPEGERLTAMGRAYVGELEHRERLLFQLQSYAASGDSTVCELVRGRYGELWNEVATLSGASPAELQSFFALGMLLTVGASLGVPEIQADEAWARSLLGPHDQPVDQR
jgi:AcrR family transcriptional regulator